MCFKNDMNILKYKIYQKLSVYCKTNWWEKDPLYTQDQKKDITFCYDTLANLFKDISKIVTDLPQTLSLEYTVCHLMMTALHVIQNDVHIFDKNTEKQSECLEHFYSSFTCYPDVDEEKYKLLMKNYDRVGRVFELLPSDSQTIIKNMCKQAGKSMSLYVKNNNTINTIKQYNEHCHLISGNVETALLNIAVIHGYESSELLINNKANQPKSHTFNGLEKSVGIFMQKANFICDYNTNVANDKQWWPKEIWKKHTKNILNMDYNCGSQSCLNEMILNALLLVPDVIKYQSLLTSHAYRKRILILSLKTIAMLEASFGNHKLFKKNITLTDDEISHIILKCNTQENFLKEFSKYLKKIKNKISLNDPNYIILRDACDKNIACCVKYSNAKELPSQPCCFLSTCLNLTTKLMWIMLIAIIISSMLSTLIFTLKSSIVDELSSHAMHGAWVGAGQAVLSKNICFNEKPKKNKKKKHKK